MFYGLAVVVFAVVTLIIACRTAIEYQQYGWGVETIRFLIETTGCLVITGIWAGVFDRNRIPVQSGM